MTSVMSAMATVVSAVMTVMTVMPAVTVVAVMTVMSAVAVMSDTVSKCAKDMGCNVSAVMTVMFFAGLGGLN